LFKAGKQASFRYKASDRTKAWPSALHRSEIIAEPNVSELICLIAQRLAELDGKIWAELNVPQQAAYVSPALMAADAAAQFFAARGLSLYDQDVLPAAAMVASAPAANMLPAE
jgi:hypothetical protein